MIQEQPSIEILGIHLNEPVTCATDLLVTAVCWYAFFHMNRREISNRSVRLMKYYFLVMGLATLLGGLMGHAFNYASSQIWKIPGWVASVIAIMLIARASIEHARPLMIERVGKFFLWLNIVEWLVLVSMTCYFLDFNWVLGYSVYGLGVVVGGFHLYVYLNTGNLASKQILQAIIVVAAGALFFIGKWRFSIWFNHMDIGHVSMAGGAWYFYLGALKMIEKENISGLHLDQVSE